LAKKKASQYSKRQLETKKTKYTLLMVFSIVILSVLVLLGLYFYLTGLDISWITFGVFAFILFMVSVTFNLMRITVDQELKKKK
jgi:hypothetical protein